MTVNAYSWFLLPRFGLGNIALRQGVITAETEHEARTYLYASMTKEEQQLCQARENILVVVPFYSWEVE